MKTAKQDNQIMSLLKVNEISRIICDTNMGTLKLRIRKGETVYQFLLDAVELPKELNNELMETIYPPNPKVEELDKAMRERFTFMDDVAKGVAHIHEFETIKHKGRPKSSKNKVKTNDRAK